MPVTRGTSNANMRGNSKDRRRRKQAMLDHYGNGEWCLCATCPTVLDAETMTVDCWPVPRCEGGTYGVPTDMSNVRPQCERCSWRQGGIMGATRKALLRNPITRVRIEESERELAEAAAGASLLTEYVGSLRDPEDLKREYVGEFSGAEVQLSCGFAHGDPTLAFQVGCEKTVSLVEFPPGRPDMAAFRAFSDSIREVSNRLLGEFAESKMARGTVEYPIMDRSEWENRYVCGCNGPGQHTCGTPR